MAESPSKNVIASFLIFLLIIGGWFFLFYIKKKSNESLVYTQEEQRQKKPERKQKENYLSKDADEDGLKDWEEILLGTDPQNTDTDADGTPDGEEIKLRRDPKKSGPGDALAVSPTENATYKALFDIASGLSGDSAVTEYRINEVIDAKLIETIKNAPPLTDAYSLKDISQMPDSEETIREYANAVGNIFQNEFNQFEKGEMVVLRDIARRNAPEELIIFKKYENAYRSAVASLLQAPVPNSYAPFHVALLNNFNNLAQINAVFAIFKDNPLNSIIYINHYNKEMGVFVKFIKDITAKLQNDDIVFSDEDPARILFQYAEELKSI